MAFDFVMDPGDCQASLAALEHVGFDEAGVAARLGLRELSDVSRRAAPIYRRKHLAQRDPLATAIDLFVLQGVVPASEVLGLFGSRGQDALRRAQILTWSGEEVRAAVSIFPVGRQLVVSDQAWPALGGDTPSIGPHDRVMYVGADSRWLARATVRRRAAEALDLCCGSGIQALEAAAHARHVTAVDMNPRAIACTRWNARQRGAANVEARLGDLYAPVAGMEFDLITANPPFVPAPSQEVGFRDGGPSGEDVQRRIVEGLPLYLRKGGIAQIVTELGEREGESLERRLRIWLGDAPMDIHLVRLRTHTAEAYAIGHAHGDTPAATLASIDHWFANLARQGYERVVSVLLAFEWSHAPWFRVDEAEPPTGMAGEEVEAVFAAERLSRDVELPERLRTGRVVATGPLAVTETRAVGVAAPAAIRAQRIGLRMAMDHPIDALERDILTSVERPVPTSEVLRLAARASVPEATVVAAMMSLVRKRLLTLSSG